MKYLAVAVLALLLPGSLAASESLSIEYYDVYGSTPHEVLGWMDRRGPSGKDGQRYHGYTKWSVGWRYQFRSRRGSCEIDSLQTTVEATITLPRWDRPDDAPQALEQEWTRYIAALRAHEDGHYRIGISAAEAVSQGLSGMRGTSGCAALGEEVNRRGTEIIGEFQARELEYDASTGHGATQGARFQVPAR